MKVFLTFDIEVWCNGWSALDERFPAAFDRYIFGRSAAGEFALPKTLEILNRYGLKGVFFVEPLFSARFGTEYLHTICQLIQSAGQEIQLHLHPEWTDEIRPAIFPDKPYKRQHLIHYDQAEQSRLIKLGRALLEAAAGAPISAFRAGSFAANGDTLAAVAEAGLLVDSSMNISCPLSGADLRDQRDLTAPQCYHGLQLVPISVFRDGFGKLRHAQIGACSVAELRQALQEALYRGYNIFTILSHNFEMLQSGSTEPDRWVVRRFEQLCSFLAAHRNDFPTRGFIETLTFPDTTSPLGVPRSGRLATMTRYYEQARRHLHHRVLR
ncbi:MAG: polysaccharide deacetylase [Gammaproteobacteria bacterium]|nr:polysaccharide deacetylase [Gammaproteobacteria bacterium]MCP5196498.1 polysaccharide deacetylase [Gammaproteobacteria bacterium]